MFPHGPIEQLSDDLFTVRGEIRFKALGRRMVIVRDASKALFIHNAIELADYTLLDALGEVRAIFVPNRYHDMDGGRMKARYPAAKLCSFSSVHQKLLKKFPSLEAFDPSILPPSASITP